MAKVKLSEREPFFVVKRGYYGHVLDEFTTIARNGIWYEANSCAYRSSVRIPNPEVAQTETLIVRIQYRIQNERRGLPTSIRYVLEVDVRCSRMFDTVPLIRMTARVDNRGTELMQRVFGEDMHHSLGRSHTKLPSMMLTPHLFACVTQPSVAFTTYPSSRKLNVNVWNALKQQTELDWSTYQRVRVKFDTEYGRKLRQATQTE